MAGTGVLLRGRGRQLAAAQGRALGFPWSRAWPGCLFGILRPVGHATRRRRRWRISACLRAGRGGAVAASRIYLDMHWLSDVIGGFALGTAYLLLAIGAAQALARRAAARPPVTLTEPIEAAPPA
jgi:membrane-associated phospholipid phosphatase